MQLGHRSKCAYAVLCGESRGILSRSLIVKGGSLVKAKRSSALWFSGTIVLLLEKISHRERPSVRRQRDRED